MKNKTDLNKNVNGLQVLDRKVYRGPHFYSHSPMISIQLDLGRLEEFPTDKLGDFAERLERLLPGLHEHGCSYGRPGGFLRRMAEGTWLGHVVEHVALELQNMAGYKVTRGKTRSVKGSPGLYNVMFTYTDEKVGLLAGRAALELVNSLLPTDLQGVDGLDRIDAYEEAEGAPFALAAALGHLKARRRKHALGPTSLCLLKEAELRDIPWMRLDETSSLIQLGFGRKQKRIQGSVTSQTSQIATDIAGDKDLTKKMLAAAGLPVPEGDYVRTAEAAVAAAERIGYPVVVKPLDGNHGRGVTTNVGNAEDVRAAFEKAQTHSRSVIIESYFEGFDHRILVVDGQMVAAAKRIPAHVVGDGVSSIKRLVDIENANPWRGEGHESYLTKIPMDDSVIRFLKKSGHDLDDVPAKGDVVYLQQTANLSSGGTAEDLTYEIHPDNKAIAERAARAVGLDVAGIDFMAADLTKSVLETGGGIIEVNASPGLRMHVRPTKGVGRNVARSILRTLFPDGENGRIPIVAITGTNGKTTTGRMLVHILQSRGMNVGLTSTTGIYVNDQRIATGDASGPRSARTILRDPQVDVAVLETARGGILREGLGFDSCDIGICLNVAADHLGLRGIHTVEDLARVKSVVVEAVRDDGFSILNADDPLTAAMERHAGGRTVYFSMLPASDRPDFLKEHIAEGGMAVVWDQTARGADILVHAEGDIYPIVRASDIPATMDCLAEFNIANAMAAIAAAFAMGVDPEHIRAALATFEASAEKLPGRLNVYEGAGRKVIVDYVHNPHGMRALSKLISSLRAQHGRVVGVLSIAGDRRDDDILEMGALSAEMFDELVFREDGNSRGRKRGDIARLLKEGAVAGNSFHGRIRIVLDEQDSICQAIQSSQAGDAIFLAVDEVDESAANVRACLAKLMEQDGKPSPGRAIVPLHPRQNGSARKSSKTFYREAS